jgi:putative addiction module component (TIGR02574 family)
MTSIHSGDENHTRAELVNPANPAYPSTMKSIENIEAEALLLPKDQRLTLAHRILSSVEPEAEAGAEAAWDTEIRERIRRYDAGLSSVVSGDEVFAKLDKKLKG